MRGECYYCGNKMSIPKFPATSTCPACGREQGHILGTVPRCALCGSAFLPVGPPDKMGLIGGEITNRMYPGLGLGVDANSYRARCSRCGDKANLSLRRPGGK